MTENEEINICYKNYWPLLAALQIRQQKLLVPLRAHIWRRDGKIRLFGSEVKKGTSTILNIRNCLKSRLAEESADRCSRKSAAKTQILRHVENL